MAETTGPHATASPGPRGDTPGSGLAENVRDWLPGHNWVWFVARGVLLILLAVAALLAPGVALFAFAMLFAAFSLVDGVFAVASGVRGARDRRERWGALVLSGMAGIAIGVLFVLFPMVSTFALAFTTVLLIAAWAVVTGVLEIAAAIRLRRTIKGEWLLALAGALSLLVGLAIAYLAATQPAITVVSVAWLIAFYALIAGVAMIVLGFRLRKLAG